MRFLNKLLLVVLALLFMAVTPVAFAETAPLETIKIAQFGKERFLLYLPLYVAMEEGLFAKQGLDVHLIFAGNDDQIFATVISGEAQFGMGDPVFTALAKERGGPGKTVAMMLTKLGLSGVTKGTAIHKITSPQQLNGLRVSSFPAPSTT
jgi:NitT/TauT family transport system substrate-binding protein